MLQSFLIFFFIFADIEEIELFQCYPTSLCEDFNCDFISDAIPEHIRNKVTKCETSCCQGDLCNRAERLSNQLTQFIAIAMALIFVFQ